MKVSILEPLGISSENLSSLKAPFEAQGIEFFDYEKTLDKELLVSEAKDADAIIIANMPLPADVIRNCKKLRFIDVAFTGVDHVGLEAAKEMNIVVSNASGYSNEAVSELVLGMTLSILRNLREVEQRCRNHEGKEGLVGQEIKGKTVGIIGLGKIGTRTAELFHAFGANIVAHSRSFHTDAPDYVQQTQLNHLLEISDIVVLHCPQNSSTIGMINKETLSLMKKTAILINAARGPVVVSDDIVDALNTGTIAAAGIDVFDSEPPLGNDVLLTSRNTLLTPHVAFATNESMLLRAQIVFDNLQSWIDGRPTNIVE